MNPSPPPVGAVNLTVWDISDNALTGTLIPDPGTFEPWMPPPSLRVFTAARNALRGSVPDVFGLHAPRLRLVDLSANAFDGDVPCSVLRLGEMRYVNLSHNRFTGTLHPLHADLDADTVVLARAARFLRVLDLSHNGLTGDVPAALTSLPALRHLDLSHNALRGSLTDEHFTVSSVPGESMLTHVDVSHNALIGSLPRTLTALTPSLRYFDASNNALSGAVPFAVLTSPLMRHVDVSGNDFDWTTLGVETVKGGGGHRGGEDAANAPALEEGGSTGTHVV